MRKLLAAALLWCIIFTAANAELDFSSYTTDDLVAIAADIEAEVERRQKITPEFIATALHDQFVQQKFSMVAQEVIPLVYDNCPTYYPISRFVDYYQNDSGNNIDVRMMDKLGPEWPDQEEYLEYLRVFYRVCLPNIGSASDAINCLNTNPDLAAPGDKITSTYNGDGYILTLVCTMNDYGNMAMTLTISQSGK